MKVLERILEKIDGYLMGIERNTDTGNYELTVGIPADWVYKDGDNIGFEVIKESKVGTLLKIFSKKDNVVIDDLIEFVNIVIDTNKKIVEMQEEFEMKLAETRKKLEDEVLGFEEMMEKVKEESFKSIEEEAKKKKEELKKEKKEEIIEKKTTKSNEDDVEELEEKLSK